MWAFVFGCLVTNVKAYPASGWPMYVQAPPREYPEDDYYYSPKIHYYGEPLNHGVPHVPAEVYGRIPYPYYPDTFNRFVDEDPIRQDERLANLPVGQETWFESETEPSWKSSDMDDVNAAFMENLILTQMAQDAQRRREYASQAKPAPPLNDYEERDVEDEDVRELKALAGKPLYHVPKTVPRVEEDDYPNDDGFINWNGNKRSVSTTVAPTLRPKLGQDEIMVPRPAQPNHRHHKEVKEDKKDSVYKKISQLLAAETKAELVSWLFEFGMLTHILRCKSSSGAFQDKHINF